MNPNEMMTYTIATIIVLFIIGYILTNVLKSVILPEDVPSSLASLWKLQFASFTLLTWIYGILLFVIYRNYSSLRRDITYNLQKLNKEEI
tara:strand:- start:2592 stop:2861 length:270 start_codon:yes stop_codon:yes gene_type:complete